MYFVDELFGPPGVRYRTGHSRAPAKRGVRGSGGRSSGRSNGETSDILLAGELPAGSPIGASLAAWGYVFQINTQTVAVGANINFSNNGPLNGISHTPGTATVIVAADGTYNLTFSVYTTQNNPQDWAVVVNGVNRQRFNSAGQTISGTTSLALNADDRVTLRNVATSPDPATLRTGDFTTAYMLIYKVDS